MQPARAAVMPSATPNTDDIREILIRRIDQQKQGVGIVVGVVDSNGRRVVAYGHLAKDDPRPLDGNTIFEVGSISKVFTSLVLANMVHRREVGLDDPAATYLPGNVKMPERGGKAITLRDLATHSSGLPRLPVNLKLTDPFNPYAGYSVDDLYDFLSSYELLRDPGSEVEYSNVGAGLLGHLLASRAGTDYEGLIRTRITEPLNMRDTGIALSASMKERMATGHSRMLEPVGNWDLPTLAGAGALRSSTNDMLTLLEAFLGYRESPLAPAMKAMLDARRPMGQAQIGLAWLLYPTDGREIAWHNGGTGGFRSFTGYDLTARIGVVVLSNACGVDDIGFHLLNPKLPLAHPGLPEQHDRIQIDSQLFDNYTGRYQVSSNLTFEISRDEDRLFAQGFAQLPHNRPGDLTGLPKFELFAESEKSFFASVSDSQIEFETGSDGRATGLVLRKAGRHMRAPRLF